MERIGGYLLQKEIGRGATARVFLAKHEDTGNEVCLKAFHPSIWQEKKSALRIENEIELSSTLKHPNIVRVHKVLRTDPPALVMDYIEGQNLETFQGQLPYVLPEVAVTIAIQILSALEYAHNAGIIHRDLKPENILVETQGRVYVTDFGHAKLRDASMGTRSNVLLGTMDYMSPEQVKGDKLSGISDLFSLASILYFLVTGTRPFSRANPTSTLSAIKDEEPESPQKRNPKVSSALSQLILKGLAKNPQKRFQSATEYREALAAYLKSVGLDISFFNLPAWIRDSSRSTLEALALSTDCLISNCEQYLEQFEPNEFLESLSHLSLKAPQSPALPRLTESYQGIKKSGRKKAVWVSAVVLLVVFLAAFVFLQTRQGLVSPEQKVMKAEAPTLAAPVSPVSVVSTPPKVDAPKRVVPKKPARRTKLKLYQPPKKKKKAKLPVEDLGTVVFDVAEDIQVYWDGRRVDSKEELSGQRLGEHFIMLQRPGFDPIRSKVIVKSGKPTVIKVN